MSATTEQPQTFQERRAAVMDAVAEQADADYRAAFGSSEETPSDPPPQPPAHGGEQDAPPAGTPNDGHAATDATRSDSPESDTPVTLTQKELAARIEEATKRQRADQSRMAQELEALRREQARLTAEREEIIAHNRALNAVRNEVRDAMERGERVDVSRLTEVALANEEGVRQQARQQEQEQAARQQQQQAALHLEAARRQDYASIGYERTIGDIRALAVEAGTPLTRADAEALVAKGYADPRVMADVDDWKDVVTVPHAKSRQRIDAAYARILDLSKEELTQRVVAKVAEEQKPLQAYNRTGVAGEPHGPVTERNLPFAQRKQRAVAAMTAAFDDDLKKFLG